MSTLTAARVVLVQRGTIKKASFPLGIAATAWYGGIACMDTAHLGAVWPGAVSTTLKPIGVFAESVNNSAGGSTTPVAVDLSRERLLEYWDSVTGGGAITIANLFQTVYIASDHELTTVATGASAYGIVWSVNPSGYPGGIGVEPLF